MSQHVTRRVSALSLGKRKYLERLRSEGQEALRPRVGAGPVPLSFAQERLWFLGLLDPTSTAYTLFHALRASALDLDALEQAVNVVGARHEVLRTGFETVDGAPVGIVAPALCIPVERHDLRGSPDPLAAGRALAAEVAQTRFDLARPPLLRIVAARLGEADTAVLLAVHHVVLDAWSVGVLLTEIGQAYRARVRGHAPALAPLPVQYADYAIWQRRVLAGPRLEAELAFWRDALRDAPPLTLPTDRPRPPVQTDRGAQERVVVDVESAAGLRSLARAEHASLFMCLLGAYALLLGRWGGQTDFLVGTPVEGRTRTELEGLVGFFVNTLVLRMRLDGEPTFRELLRRVRQVALDAYAHAELPFEQLVKELAPERLLSRAPVFQTMFQLQTPPPSLPLGRLPADDGVTVPGCHALFDLSLDLFDGPHGLEGRLEYSTDLFEAATIARMARHYETLLAAIAADPDAPIGSLPLLTDGERSQLLVWNDTAAPLPDELVHDLVAVQARRTPQASAIEHRGAVLTYADLDARVDRLAGHLAALGAARDRPVALLLDRGPDLVAAQLAVLRAGSAYLPLDVATPAHRLAGLLRRTEPFVLVTTADRVVGLPEDAPPPVLLDRPLHPARATPRTAAPDDLAYLVATSGTTGTPKIVEVPHRAVVNHARAIADAFALQPGDRVVQLASPAFDVQMEEVLPTLVAGATLVVPDQPGMLGLDELLGAEDRRAVTVLNLPSPLWHDWLLAVEAGLVGVPPSLRLIVIGSDRVVPEDLVRFAALPAPRPRLVQAYGVTEATITSLLHDVPDGAGPEEADVIGRPVQNVEAHVLDASGAQQPVGAPGELYLGGVALARGYYDDPEVTRVAFGPHAFAPATRLYRTGDRVVRRADGALRFLGRLDHQVKVRGVRVELEEVAAQLRAHPGVHDAVAALHEDALAAWVVPATDPAPAAHALRAHLSGRLPAAAVPATYTLLPALPRTPDGKLDRSALQAPRPAAVAPPASRRTATEEAVAAVWRDVLGRDVPGRDDSFFELGGHSLLLVRAHARLAGTLAPGLTVLDLFRHPTVRTLAARIEELAS